MKSIQILGAAQRDLIRGYRFYERQASGAGRYFLDTPYSEIESLGINAGIHPILFGDYHRLLPKHLPWSVYYKVKGSIVLIHAVIDNRSLSMVVRAFFETNKLFQGCWTLPNLARNASPIRAIPMPTGHKFLP